MTSQQFNLRWNNHTNNLLQDMYEKWEQEKMVDVTLSCQGKFIKAHKMVLGACSPYFQEIFDRHSTPHPVIIMNGLKIEDVRAIVEFMYKGEVKVCESELESLLSAAENLQIKGLSNVRSTRQGQNSPSSTTNQNSSNNNPDTKSGNNNAFSHSNSNHSSSGRSNSSSTHSNDKGNSDLQQESTGTPLHLRRKRGKTSSPNKDVNLHEKNDNSISDTQSAAKGENYSSKSVAQGVVSSVDDENSSDLPMTIRIDPPHIRDIDEEDEVEWDSTVKDNTNFPEPCDGSQDAKGLMEPKEKIPRPPNAFMIFANEWRRKLATQHPNESNKEISVRLGIMWKNLAGDSKEDYFAASRQANEDHKRKYPDYYYSPKEARMRKRWKMQQQQVNHLMSSGQYNPVHLVKVFMNEDGDGGERQTKSNAH